MVVKIPQRAPAVDWPPNLDDATKKAALKLVNFYGSSLPRPRIFPDPKSNDDRVRVDPPVPVLDPLLSWANEAHWSMGGLSFKRLRLQGRIEGSVEKLRAQREKALKKSPKSDPVAGKSKGKGKRAASVSPPPAPMAVKRRRYLALSEDEDEDEEDKDEDEELKHAVEEEEEAPVMTTKSLRKGPVRKLGDDFERVAKESNQSGVEATKVVDEVIQGLRSKGEKGMRTGKSGFGTRNSPRLIKRSPS